MVQPVAETDPRQRLSGIVGPGLAADQRGEHHVFHRGQLGEEEVALENEADPLIAQPRLHRLATLVEPHPVELHGPRLRSLQPGQRVEQRRFARARRAAQKHRLPALDLRADTAQHLDRPRADFE